MASNFQSRCENKHFKCSDMKKIIAYCSALAICAMLAASTLGHAQNNQVDENTPQKLTDATMSKQLALDWNARNPALKDQPVYWFDTNDGYFGTYAIDSNEYMARYDSMGKYIETMNRKEWDEMVPMNLKTSFENSKYKTQQVISYWEVSDPNRKGYYLELKDNQDKVTRLWADEKGSFTTTPYQGSPNK